MLQDISIKNFAIIEDIHLQFDNGMTILTGETGAGKSIIIDAMNLLLGSRASVDFVRHGADKSQIEGLFFYETTAGINEKLEQLGIEDTGELILRREIFSNGRSVCRINGQMVNLTSLREIGEHLVDIHGQHDHQELMNPKQHQVMLDEFGGKEFIAVKKAYQDKFETYRNLRSKLLERKRNEQEFAQRIDVLQFQIDEIQTAEIDLTEDEKLQARREILVNSKNIVDSLNIAYAALDDEDYSSLSNVRNAMNEVETIEDFSPLYKEISSKVAESYYILEDVTASLAKALDDLEFNPNELMFLEDRIAVLATLKKKYGPELSDVLSYLDNIKNELADLTGGENDNESLETLVKDAEKELVIASNNLNDMRRKLASDLEKDIKNELKDLYMEKADFKVNFEKAKFNRQGNEHIEFFIQTNPGEGFKPLAKTASGGELSRLMLAIKSSFSRKENKTSIVFDEVDTGVSGRVAQAIANKIYKISAAGQVLCISHLPQVVAIADTQFYIEKQSSDDVTTSTVRKLDYEERVEEIAKMLAGDDISKEARAQAEKLLVK
ncbi:DNA repair protein RecN [Floricoccus penangensis]|uniref:DNA repair protein RecN n=1 Tax=Floricoccus penangensis TaxID=1859475 RepID=A0A9Q5JHW1_9LACT|nr:DNA repair protein RecN [Floricoccus penangensis]OFI47837.1 DNA repair protein RecN [Floricoccus penangensis]URZ88463.1 DNA repair protein RecN [Floricoccus penangensis]